MAYTDVDKKKMYESVSDRFDKCGGRTPEFC